MAAIDLRQGVYIEKDHHDETDQFWYLVDELQSISIRISDKVKNIINGTTRPYELVSDEDRTTLVNQLRQKNMLSGQAYVKKNAENHLSVLKIELLKPYRYINYLNFLGVLFKPSVFALFCLFWLFILWLLTHQWSDFISYHNTYSDAVPYILTATILTKLFHEHGHAIAMHRSKITPLSMGINFIAWILPLPFTTGGIYHHTTPWQRGQYALAGIYFEAWIALIAAFMWLSLADGALRTAAHFLVVISFGLTISMNLLPLLKFDGYHALAAYLANPMLYEQSINRFSFAIYRHLGFNVEIPHYPHRYLNYMFTYGLAIFIWRIILPISIILAIWYMFDNHYIAAMLCISPFYFMILKPITKIYRTMRQFGKPRLTLLNVSLAITLLLITAWLCLPIKHSNNYIGVIQSPKSPVIANGNGDITYLKATSEVKKGDLLAVIEDKDVQLSFEKEKKRQLQAIQKINNAQISQAEFDVLWNSGNEKIEYYQDSIKKNKLYAAYDGTWLANNNPSKINNGASLGSIILNGKEKQLTVYIPHGEPVGEIIQGSAIIEGRGIKIELKKQSQYTNKTAIPAWLVNANLIDTSQSIMPFYSFQGEIQTPSLTPDALVNTIVVSQYSIIKRLYDRLSSRL